MKKAFIMSFCKNCLLPGTVPGADLDDRQVCHFCREHDAQKHTDDEEKRRAREADLEKALISCRNQGAYDCLVPFSGGKDSLYLLYKLKVDYKLKILAYTTNLNIPPLAWRNIHRALKILDIDHISYSPSYRFYSKLFRYLFQNQEERGAVYTISYVYAPLFEGDAIRLAIEKEIPLILAGYSPGQPEPERMLYEFSPKLLQKVDWTPPTLKKSGYFTAEELEKFYNPTQLPESTRFPRYLAPFHAWPYNQAEVMAAVVKHRLVTSTKQANPIFTNYPINWLCMYSDLKHFGYNPYQTEFSALVREGKASRTYWKIARPIVNTMIRKKIMLGREVENGLKWLKLEENDLKINQPRGAYDPVW